MKLVCPNCNNIFQRPDSVVRTMKKRNPNVVLSCSRECCDLLKQKKVSLSEFSGMV